MVSATCESIGLRQVIDEHFKGDSRRCRLSPGERVTALILNILSRRRPLYRVWETCEDTDVELSSAAASPSTI